jgi:hypothetical protein
MAVPDTAKPATEPVNGLHSIEQLGGTLNSNDSNTLPDLQTVFGRRVVVIREPIGQRFRTGAPR